MESSSPRERSVRPPAPRQRLRPRAALRRRRLRGHPRLQRTRLQARTPHRPPRSFGEGDPARHSAPRRDEIAESCSIPAARNEIVDGYIRLVVTRGAGTSASTRARARRRDDRHRRAERALYRPSSRTRSRSRHVVAAAAAPDALSPSIKSLNYLNNALAKIEANDGGADEALILNHNGYVAEAPSTTFSSSRRR